MDNAANLKSRPKSLKVRLLAHYYEKILKDLKIICITGTTGKTVTAYYVYYMLKQAGFRPAILASDEEIKVGNLYKFIKDAWNADVDYLVLTAPAHSLRKDVFYKMPIQVAALTDFVPAGLSDLTAEEYLEAENTLFSMNPDSVVLNRDDRHYLDFAVFKGVTNTLTYGTDYNSDLRIENSKLYKKGSEAELNYHGYRFNVASFLTGEPNISYMACAATIGQALNLSKEHIINGIADFEVNQEETE